MAKGVPSSFQELKQKTRKRIQHGDHDVKSDVIEMGNAMQQGGVEPKSAQDRMAKRVWQAASPEEKEKLAGVVTNMAKNDSDLQ